MFVGFRGDDSQRHVKDGGRKQRRLNSSFKVIRIVRIYTKLTNNLNNLLDSRKISGS